MGRSGTSVEGGAGRFAEFLLQVGNTLIQERDISRIKRFAGPRGAGLVEGRQNLLNRAGRHGRKGSIGEYYTLVITV